MLMLVWLENHLIVLGLLAIVVGLGLGAVLASAQRNAGRITDSRRRSAASSGATGSRTTGADSVSPRYQARSW
jgi:hypothetical protein